MVYDLSLVAAFTDPRARFFTKVTDKTKMMGSVKQSKLGGEV